MIGFEIPSISQMCSALTLSLASGSRTLGQTAGMGREANLVRSSSDHGKKNGHSRHKGQHDIRVTQNTKRVGEVKVSPCCDHAGDAGQVGCPKRVLARCGKERRQETGEE